MFVNKASLADKFPRPSCSSGDLATRATYADADMFPDTVQNFEPCGLAQMITALPALFDRSRRGRQAQTTVAFVDYAGTVPSFTFSFPDAHDLLLRTTITEACGVFRFVSLRGAS